MPGENDGKFYDPRHEDVQQPPGPPVSGPRLEEGATVNVLGCHINIDTNLRQKCPLVEKE